MTDNKTKKQKREIAREIGEKLQNKLDSPGIDRSVSWFWKNFIESADVDISLFGFYNLIKGASGTYDDKILDIMREFIGEV